jgi:hypothetical protein
MGHEVQIIWQHRYRRWAVVDRADGSDYLFVLACFRWRWMARLWRWMVRGEGA